MPIGKMKTAAAALLLALAIAVPASAFTNEFAENTNRWQGSGYRPNFFIFGNPLSKLSLSFKVQLIERTELYLAYSQLMFWELQSDSKPFRDINYNPEIFYRVHLDRERCQWLDIGAYEHESNGKDGADTRSWDRVYVRFNTGTPVGRAKLFWSFKAWVPFNYDWTNEDIAAYRGLWEAEIVLKDFLGPAFDRDDLTLRFYPGGPSHTDPLRGGQELTYRVNRAIVKEVLPMWVIQLFHGYGENLLDYKDEKTVLRIGFGF